MLYYLDYSVELYNDCVVVGALVALSSSQLNMGRTLTHCCSHQAATEFCCIMVFP